MEKVRLWCGQPSDRRRLKNRTDRTADADVSLVQCVCGHRHIAMYTVVLTDSCTSIVYRSISPVPVFTAEGGNLILYITSADLCSLFCCRLTNDYL